MSSPVLSFWDDTVSTWDSLFGVWDSNFNAVPCAAITAPAFPEVYPNRIPEDIYDSFGGELMDVWNSAAASGVWDSTIDVWGQIGFIFVVYGPTLNH